MGGLCVNLLSTFCKEAKKSNCSTFACGTYVVIEKYKGTLVTTKKIGLALGDKKNSVIEGKYLQILNENIKIKTTWIP